MSFNSTDLLHRLGAGELIDSLCTLAGWTRDRFDAWWRDECRQRQTTDTGKQSLPGLKSSVRLSRDTWGVPSIDAENDHDLFLALGYATAQDRLFQLDYLRHRAHGRLAEILGPEGVDSDTLYRTLGLSHIANAEWDSLPANVRAVLDAYTAGINAFLAAHPEKLPIEFALLDYRPEPWSPLDSLVIAGEFRWYLTGRFPVLVIPELVKRAVGEGSLYRAFLQGEEDTESILPGASISPGGLTSGESNDSGGSNNWVLAGTRTTTGKPIVASDPHVPFGAVSIWHEVHLRGKDYRVAGVTYTGVPAVMIGRTEQLAWGITNNICSLRDLYMEKTDPAYPGCFLFDGRWEPAKQREEVIQVRGASPIKKTILSSRNGPIVDAVLPPLARGHGLISLRWLGAEPCGWLTSLLGMNRAKTCSEFRAATRGWSVPTFNLVYADDQGHIGHQCVGRIPLRPVAERGYRPGWDPQHQWTGFIPFEAMPHQSDPPRGYVVTANNRLAPDDYPYPLSGTWSSGHRARRIRERLEAEPRWSPEASAKLQLDIRSGRAAQCVPPLLTLLEGEGENDQQVQQAVRLLRDWDFRMTSESIQPALFNLFFIHWSRAVVAERLSREQVEFAAPNAGGLATALLSDDPASWFTKTDRRAAARLAFRAALAELSSRLGPQMKDWSWHRLHVLSQKHYLSARGDLGKLLDRNGCPAPGDATTVCSTTPDASYAAHLGASYRMIADLADPHAGLVAVSLPGNNGNPGSPHYDDQIEPWRDGKFHPLSLRESKDAGQMMLILNPVTTR